jgi:hypothetical protein
VPSGDPIRIGTGLALTGGSAPAGVGDFYANGTNDVLYRNSSSGDTWFEAMSNGVFAGWHQVGGPDTRYSIAGVAVADVRQQGRAQMRGGPWCRYRGDLRRVARLLSCRDQGHAATQGDLTAFIDIRLPERYSRFGPSTRIASR